MYPSFESSVHSIVDSFEISSHLFQVALYLNPLPPCSFYAWSTSLPVAVVTWILRYEATELLSKNRILFEGILLKISIYSLDLTKCEIWGFELKADIFRNEKTLLICHLGSKKQELKFVVYKLDLYKNRKLDSEAPYSLTKSPK